MINTIIDMYHGNRIDLEEVHDGGVVAIIHKATQGANFRDSKYHQRREEGVPRGAGFDAILNAPDARQRKRSKRGRKQRY